MARTTPDLVKEIIEVDEDLGTLDPFIDIANQLVTELCEPLNYYSEERLTIIETWLAAHLWTSLDPRIQTQFADGVGVTFQNKIGLGLDHSTYGQMVKRLDTKGVLAQLDVNAAKGGKITATLAHLACPPETTETEEE